MIVPRDEISTAQVRAEREALMAIAHHD